MAMRAEQDAVHSTLAQLNATRQDMLAHNERHIFVLAAVQTVVHELAREAKDLQHQIAFIAQQQQKLSSLVRQMNTKAEEVILFSSLPLGNIYLMILSHDRVGPVLVFRFLNR